MSCMLDQPGRLRNCNGPSETKTWIFWPRSPSAAETWVHSAFGGELLRNLEAPPGVLKPSSIR